jgi:sulfoxide reductase heme-binding subunit YedZ
VTAAVPTLASLAAQSSGSGSPLWYLSRGTGIVCLVLLTLVVALGVLTRRGAPSGGQTFVLAGIHRNASLLVLCLLAVHIVTSVLDPYAPISMVDAVLPFGSAYRPLWLGLGALAFDLLIALVVTSLLRLRIGLRWWRGVHWLAYLAWPVAVLHGLGTGSDTSSGWALAITAGCVLAVAAAVLTRARMLDDRLAGRRAGAIAAATIGPLALAGWLLIGPLAPGWAARAGTPPQLIATGGTGGNGTTSASDTSTGSGRSGGGKASSGTPSGTAQWSGQVTRRQRADGTIEIVLAGRLTGGPGGRLEVRLVGQPQDGGVAMSSGTVTLTTASAARWTGPVTSLNGTRIDARLAAAAGGVSVSVTITVQLADSGALTGTAVFG